MCTLNGNWIYEEKLTWNENNVGFECQMNSLCENILKIIVNSVILDNYKNNDGMDKNCDDDLRNLVENNKSLRQKLDIKVKDFHQQQIRYKTFKHDQKLLSQEIKEKHEAFLMAKKCYKKFLKMYYSVDSKIDSKQTAYVQFFTEAKKESDNYSIRLIKHLDSGKYELLNTNPRLKNFHEIQKKLQESNDTPGALCCIRQYFLTLKASSNKTSNKIK